MAEGCAYWYERAEAGGYTLYEAHVCGKPAQEHYERRNDVAPPAGSIWSTDRDYYPNHEFVPLPPPAGQQGAGK